MKLGGTQKKTGTVPVDPFGAIGTAGGQPAGPGVGAPRQYIMKPKTNKRVRFANQVLGDTPPRDGPFAMAAAPVAVAFPPKTRVEQRRRLTGPNPFSEGQAKRTL